MALGLSGRKREPLYVVRMALALATAAALGGALGLAWHAMDFGESETQPAEEAK